MGGIARRDLPEGIRLLEVGEAVPASRDPAICYLASLSSKESSRTMTAALNKLAELVGASSFRLIEWGSMRYPHVIALRAIITRLELSASTKNRLLTALRRVALQAFRLGMMDASDYHAIQTCEGIPGASVIRGRCLDHGEIAALFSCTLGARSSGGLSGFRDRAALALIFGNGLRRREVCSLLVGDLGDRILVKGKGGKQRRVPFAPNTEAHVNAWLEAAGITEGPILRAVTRHQTVSPAPLHPDSLRRRCETLSQRAGIAPFSPHDARRTYATHLIESGADLLVVQRLLGHASVNTVAVYDRRPEEAEARAVSAVYLPALL